VPDFRNYLIFYRIAADEVQILRVLHAARGLESALEEER
jgi:plasmid stabilization system protein ParE